MRHLNLVLALAFPSLLSAQARAPEKWVDDVMSIRGSVSGDPQWSPDGLSVTYAGSGGLWTVPAAGGTPTQLVTDMGGVPFQLSQQPRWSPKGDYIAYISDRQSENTNATDIWLWSPRTKQHTRLTQLATRIGNTSWSPDGRHIAFSGALNGNYDIFTVSVPDGVVTQLTRDVRFETTPVWTPDSRNIVFVRNDERWVDHDVMRIAATGGEPQLIVRDTDYFDYNLSATPASGIPMISPDGKWLVFRSWRSGWQNYWAVPATGGTPVQIARETADQQSGTWSPDGRSFAFTSNHDGTHDVRVVTVDATGSTVRFGAPRVLFAPTLGIASNLAWSPDSRRIAYTLVSPTRPSDLYTVNVADGKTAQLTSVPENDAVVAQLVTPEKITYKSDSLTISAYLYRPKNAQPGQRFATIVFGHGGPTSQYGDSFDMQMQYFAGLGYMVLAPNFRGSSGYGRAFADLNNKCWAHCDLADLVAGVKHLETQPTSNGKFGATGSSHGGLLAMAAATFAPGVFDAAIASGGTADRIYYYKTQELRHLKQADNEFGPLETNEETYRYVSPFYYAKEVNTPIFVIWGEGKWPGSMNSKNYVTELERFYKTHRAKIYTGENYYVSSRPNVRQMMLDMTDFFEQYLQPAPTGGAPKATSLRSNSTDAGTP